MTRLSISRATEVARPPRPRRAWKAALASMTLACFAACVEAQSTGPTTSTRPTTSPADVAKVAALGSTGLPAHDPSTIVRCKGTFWVFATGNGLQAARSTDLKTWTRVRGPVIAMPDWVAREVPGNRNGHFWAPDVIELNGRYLLYYSVSSWGKNQSVIAVAENATLDPDDPNFKWIDRGVVVRSAREDNYNAIDPAITRDADGRLWMSFGSFWGGIQLVELDRKTGGALQGAPIRAIAWNKEIEAPAIHRHGGHYYLFVSWGLCCKGANSTYHIRVGRSRSIEGPYVDKEGRDMAKGGGTLLLGSDGPFVGPGHPSFLVAPDGRERIAMHFYDVTHGGRGTLAIRSLTWDADGWPRVSVAE